MSFLLEGQPSDLRPDEQDMEGVTQALARLQFVYRFYARKNKNFNLNKTKYFRLRLDEAQRDFRLTWG